MGTSLSLLVLSLPFLFALFVAGSFAAFLIRRKREHREIVLAAEERDEELEEKEDAQEATFLWLAIKEHFPYLPTPRPPALSAEEIRAAIAETLSSVPSLGTFGNRLPAPGLPESERRRHLYVVGKTGSGKTTFLEHLVAADLDAGRGLAVIGPEGELFQRLLSFVPEKRHGEVVYFAPGNPECPLSWNPLQVEAGDDRARAAEDLFTVFRRSLSDDSLGPRMEPILQNGFAALTGRANATLWDLKRLLEDPPFRDEVAYSTEDPYVRSFWLETFPRYPKGADLPVLNRLDHFLRPSAVRRTIASPESSFSIREILGKGGILFLDLYGLGEETRLLLGQMILSKFGLELLRRELSGTPAETFFLYCDEIQATAGLAEGVWRELLSRGRKYGLALTLANQYPAQLPQGLRDEIFGNVNSLVAFSLGAKDTELVRKELLGRTEDKKGVRLEAIPREELLSLRVGEAYAKLAGGHAVKLSIPSPRRVAGTKKAETLIRESWERFRVSRPASEPPQAKPAVREPESFLE